MYLSATLLPAPKREGADLIRYVRQIPGGEVAIETDGSRWFASSGSVEVGPFNRAHIALLALVEHDATPITSEQLQAVQDFATLARSRFPRPARGRRR